MALDASSILESASGVKRKSHIDKMQDLAEQLEKLKREPKSVEKPTSPPETAATQKATTLDKTTRDIAAESKKAAESYATAKSNLSKAQSAVAKAKGVGDETLEDLKKIQSHAETARKEDITREEKEALQSEIDAIVEEIAHRVKQAAEDGINLAAGGKKAAASVNNLGTTESGTKVDVSGVGFDLKSLGLENGVSLDSDNGDIAKMLRDAVDSVNKDIRALETAADTIQNNSELIEEERLESDTAFAIAAFEAYKTEKNAEFFGDKKNLESVESANGAAKDVETVRKAALKEAEDVANQLTSLNYPIANNNHSYILGLFGAS